MLIFTWNIWEEKHLEVGAGPNFRGFFYINFFLKWMPDKKLPLRKLNIFWAFKQLIIADNNSQKDK